MSPPILTGAQRLALAVLCDLRPQRRDGAEGSRDASRKPVAAWMTHVVNTRAAEALVKLGLAKRWEALPDGTVIEGAQLVYNLGRYRTRYAATAAGRAEHRRRVREYSRRDRGAL